MANDSLYSVKLSEIWWYFKSQDILFWLINIYLFMEYVRPQTLYPSLDVIPFTRIILIVTLVILLFKKYPLPKNISNTLIILFTIVIILSSMFAISPGVSFSKIYDYFAWVVIYFLIITIINTSERLFVFVFLFLVYSFKMSQFSFRNWVASGFSFSDWGTGGGAGWFHNSGEFGIQMCVFLAVSCYFYYSLKDRWPWWKKGVFLLFPLTALSGTISCSSRGALVGAGAVLFWMLLNSSHKIKGFVVLALVGVLVWHFTPSEQKERFRQAGKDKTSIQRTERWEKGLRMAERSPLLGVGYANWEVADKRFFSGEGGLPHNIFIECISELGYSGFIVFILLIFSTFFNNYRTRKVLCRYDMKSSHLYYLAHGLDAALVGYLVSGYFVTVLYYPYFWINLSMTVALSSIVKATNKDTAKLPINCKIA
ncbi:MAG: O-antigen ligase family protein [Geobacteraceae bacterium]|nr:O-antigen ligase family protein [Geobacteraceae bacterium]